MERNKTQDSIVQELRYIQERVSWLKAQPRGSDGRLAIQDDQDECGVLFRRITELEKYWRESLFT
jgi:hypothetical protein